MFRSFIRSAAVWAAVVSCFVCVDAPPLLAQAANATLTGLVVDDTAGVVPDADVSVVNVATMVRRQTRTNADGTFTVALLPPGRYTVRVEPRGFAPGEVRDVVLNVGDQVAIRVQLKVAPIDESVSVVAGSHVKTSAAVSTIVDRQFVENLPLNGRSFQSLIALTPGLAIAKSNFREPGQFSVNGQRTNANYFMVDGVSANAGTNATFPLGPYAGGTVPALSSGGGTNSLVSVDAMQEFRIQTSTYAPEFGRSPGAQISIVTRSGTNQFHGTVFDYLRNDAMDANDWFANRDHLGKPKLRQNDFGGVLGGPLPIDRTFFFFSYEGLRLRQPQVGQASVPTMATRELAPAVVRPMVDLFPIPNQEDVGNGLARFAISYSDPSTLDATSLKLDHAFGNSTTVFGRYNRAPSDAVHGFIFPSRTTMNVQTLTLGATQTLSSRLLHDLRVNYSKSSGGAFYEPTTVGGAIDPPASAYLPSFATPENAIIFWQPQGGSYSWRRGKNVANIQRQFNLVDTVSLVSAAHQWKFGADYRLLLPTYSPRIFDELVNFNGFTGPNGVYSLQATSVNISGRDGMDLAVWNLSLFAQDTWRAAPRLTVTYGVRWDLNPPPEGRGGKELYAIEGDLDSPQTIHYSPPGTPLFDTVYTNFAPRVGVAYQLSDRPGRELVVRGGVGIFFDVGAGSAADTATSFPYSRSVTYANVPWPLPASVATPPPLTTDPPYGSVYAIDPHIKSPRTYQWNVAIEPSLGTHQRMSITYVGAAGRELLRGERVYNVPNFSDISLNRNSATSDYHALQVQFQRQLSHGLQALASYTWAHSIDIMSTESAGLATPNSVAVTPQQDRGDADFDVRHTVSAAVTYNLPTVGRQPWIRASLGDWSIDAIARAMTATPVNVTYTGDFGYGSFTARPDIVPGVPVYLDDPTAPGGLRFNTAAFVIPTNRQGTLGRNALRGFPAWQVDLALRRRFHVTGNVALQVGAEMFNLFNHANFADPTAAMSSALFGVSTAMLGRSLGDGGAASLNSLYQIGGPRSVQLSAKVLF